MGTENNGGVDDDRSLCERRCEMVPGDLIGWVYRNSNNLVNNYERLWLTMTQSWAPIGSSLTHVLVSIDGEQISWLNEDGLFNVRVGEIYLTTSTASYAAVVPRKCE